jgi:hypothetical protein
MMSLDIELFKCSNKITLSNRYDILYEFIIASIEISKHSDIGHPEYDFNVINISSKSVKEAKVSIYYSEYLHRILIHVPDLKYVFTIYSEDDDMNESVISINDIRYTYEQLVKKVKE